ncbi:MAG: glycosyltransferase, partial [Desulfotomaculaceae bacterium]|nr:glycosyltransferase [Desulfotomaculaceae bacterium]
PRVPGFQILKYLEFIIRAVLISLRLRVDICHAHDLNALVPAYIAARLLKAYLIYDSHELATQRNIPRRRLWGEMTLWRCLEKFLIRKAHLVITVSPEIAAELARLYGIDPPQVIMNCPPYEEVPRNNILRDHFGIDRADIIVIYQGVFAPNRGLEVLIESLLHLADKYKLVLLGPHNTYKESLKGLADKLNVLQRVYWHEGVPVDDVVKYVASADIGTFLSNPAIKSHRLGLPNKLFECMVAGTPIVVGTICRELVMELEVGVACDQSDSLSLAAAINKLYSDRELYDRAQINAKKWARQEYNWQVQGEKLVALYGNMLQHRLRYTNVS